MGGGARVIQSRALCVFVVFAATGVAACRSGRGEDGPAGTAPSAIHTDSPPRDHLADGELLEGDGRAFDLQLPRGLRVEGSFVDVVFAAGPLPVHSLVQFFQPRLIGGDLREGPDAATFVHVQVAQKPGRKLTVHIARGPRETRLEIRDETPPPPQNLPDEAARWRAVGLTSDGRLVDPTHLQ
jgi:hypothetical protein